MRNTLQSLPASFSDIFNWKDEESKGRTVILCSTVLAGLYNLFISGIFYSGFLAMYGISITGTGILSVLPQIANMFCIFSSKILRRFEHRKKLLLTAKFIYYFIYIIFTTVMPSIVKNPDARLVCFIIITICSSLLYSPFSPGFTVWFYNFYPKNNDKRTKFILYMQIFSSVLSSFLLIFSSLLTDALKGSPYQNTLILCFRYFAFIFVLVDLFFQSRAKEYPYEEKEEAKLSDIFTLPFQHKKFLYCMFLCFFWIYIAAMPSNLWSYHLLNHLEYSYTLINAMTVLYTVILVIFSSMWEKILRRYSWIKSFGLALVFWIPTEFFSFFLTKDTTLMYVLLSITQNIILIGINLTYANLFYINLPNTNTTVHTSFHAIFSNVFSFLGALTGTFLSSISGDHTILIWNREVYTVQFIPVLRGILMIIISFIMLTKWRALTPENHIAELEHYNTTQNKKRYRTFKRSFRQ